MSRREREERIHELLKHVQQQRLDLSAARREFGSPPGRARV